MIITPAMIAAFRSNPLLKAFIDTAKWPDELIIEALREQAGRAGVKVNKTWGKARLLEEIAKVTKAE